MVFAFGYIYQNYSTDFTLGAIVSAINQVVPGKASPIVDGPSGILPKLPATLISEGLFAPVDFIGGHCTNDGRTFVGGSPQDFVTDEDVTERVFSRWGEHIVSTLRCSPGINVIE